MSLSSPALAPISAAPFRVGIVAASYNERLVGALLAQAVATLERAGLRKTHLTVIRVPGSTEIPVAAQWLGRIERGAEFARAAVAMAALKKKGRA